MEEEMLHITVEKSVKRASQSFSKTYENFALNNYRGSSLTLSCFGSSLTSLVLVDCLLDDKFMRTIKMYLEETRTLTIFDVSWNIIGSDGAKDLASVIEKNSSITSMNIAGNRLTGIWLSKKNILGKVDLSGIKKIFTSLKKSSSLLHLDMRSCKLGGVYNTNFPNLFEYGAIIEETIIKTFPVCKFLQTLNILSNEFNSEIFLMTKIIEKCANQNKSIALHTFCGIFPNQSTLAWNDKNLTSTDLYLFIKEMYNHLELTSINLSSNKLLGDATIQSLLQNIPKCCDRLRSLSLLDTGIGILTANELNAYLSSKKCHLTFLDISRNPLVEGTGITNIMESISKNKTLLTLNINYCEIQDKGAAEIGRALMTNTVLQSLEIDDNSITDTGLISISAAMQVNRSLQKLSVMGNAVSGPSFLHLVHTINTSSTLTELKIGLNRIWSNKPSEEEFQNTAAPSATDPPLFPPHPAPAPATLPHHPDAIQFDNQNYIDSEFFPNADTASNSLLDEYEYVVGLLGSNYSLIEREFAGVMFRPTRRLLTLHLNRTVDANSLQNCLQTFSALFVVSHRVPVQGVVSGLLSLNLSDCMLGVDGAAVLGGVLRIPRCNISTLLLVHNGFGAEGCLVLCEGLAVNKSLQILDLSNNELAISFGVSDIEYHISAVIALFDTIMNSECLVEVNLRRNSIFGPSTEFESSYENTALDALLHSIESSNKPKKTLECLDLLENRLPNSSEKYNAVEKLLSSIMTALKSHISLRSICGIKRYPIQKVIDLRNSGMSSLWVFVLTEELKYYHNNIIKLLLSHNPLITDVAVNYIRSFVDSSGSLQMISLHNTNISQENIEQLDNDKLVLYERRVLVEQCFRCSWDDIFDEKTKKRIFDYIWGSTFIRKQY